MKKEGLAMIVLLYACLHVLPSSQTDRRSDFQDHSCQRCCTDAVEEEHNTTVSIEALLQQQAAVIQNLQAGLANMEVRLQNQTHTIEHQAAMLSNVTSLLANLTATLGNQDDCSAAAAVGFSADFGGHSQFHDVTIDHNDTVRFDRVLTNEGQGYDPISGVFTAPFPGLYTFSLHFVGGRHGDITNLGVYVDDDQLQAVALSEGNSRDSNDQGSCTAVVSLQRGQTVSVKVEYGNPTIWGSLATSFSGTLTHPFC